MSLNINRKSLTLSPVQAKKIHVKTGVNVLRANCYKGIKKKHCHEMQFLSRVIGFYKDMTL